VAASVAVSDAVVVEQVAVAYGSTAALDGIGLHVAPGGTLAVLGHNGAGKTSLVRVMTTSIRPDRGRVVIDGVDAIEHPAEVRRRIGVTGQYAGLDDFLTTFENLELVGRLAGLRGAARGRAGDLVDRFELHGVFDRRVGELSGGTRRRVDLAASLVGSPSVLFLDEPTTGLDPAARQALWKVVAELTAAGTTVVLTTQYLEEADRLADHVVVLDHGRIAAQGTPSELKSLIGGKIVRATLPAHRVSSLPRSPDATEPVEDGRVRVSFTLADAETAAQLVSVIAAGSDEMTDLDVTSPSLDDVFFHLATTGAPA
jgi:ABC-2 type transport system ATP-binding protein